MASLRSGSTGIGYTFETLLGIEENNDQTADFRGIEIKCKLGKEKDSPAGRTNLFQLGPVWGVAGSSLDRLRVIGEVDQHGSLRCYSRVTTRPNNKKLWIRVGDVPRDIDLLRDQDTIGMWTRERLAERLAEKHSRAVFVKAFRKHDRGVDLYHYRELIYCERPDIDRFPGHGRGATNRLRVHHERVGRNREKSWISMANGRSA